MSSVFRCKKILSSFLLVSVIFNNFLYLVPLAQAEESVTELAETEVSVPESAEPFPQLSVIPETPIIENPDPVVPEEADDGTVVNPSVSENASATSTEEDSDFAPIEPELSTTSPVSEFPEDSASATPSETDAGTVASSSEPIETLPTADATTARTMTKDSGKFFLKTAPGDYVLRVKKVEGSNLVNLHESNVSVGAEGVLNETVRI